MGELNGFRKYERKTPAYEEVSKRLKHFNTFDIDLNDQLKVEQASRCMDCGVPFCHSGCPLGNRIPEFNEAVSNHDWRLAYQLLESTNNFPEFTGRICPAPCEASCVLGINRDPVSIEYIEKTIIEKAFKERWINPKCDIQRTGYRISIVGSGPAGLAAADQLNKMGHTVVVYEKNIRPGGLLRFGIPDFKLEKNIVARRIRLMEAEGVEFKCGIEVGADISGQCLLDESDALLLCCGSTVPRDLNIEGRAFQGVHFAMDLLENNNKRIAGDIVDFSRFDFKGKNVVVIGGGDTGSDCIGTVNRLGAVSVTQLELLAKPSNSRSDNDPWPLWPMTLKTSSSHEEGCERKWSVLTKKFLSSDGKNLSGIQLVNIDWQLNGEQQLDMVEIEGSEQTIPCDYVFLAIGYLHPQLRGLVEELGLDLDARNNMDTKHYQTSRKAVFSAGDMRKGQSLVVWAIAEGREAASAINEYLLQKDK